MVNPGKCEVRWTPTHTLDWILLVGWIVIALSPWLIVEIVVLWTISTEALGRLTRRLPNRPLPGRPPRG